MHLSLSRSFILACAISLGQLHATPPDADLERATRQTREYLQNTSQAHDPRMPSPGNRPFDQAVGTMARNLGVDGLWPDLNYNDQNRGLWSPSLHLKRVLEMTRAYTIPGQSLQGNPALGKAIHRAFDAWLQKDYRSSNWWHNQIGVPTNTAAIMLLMQPELSPWEMEQGLKITARAKIGMTGQNRVWLAGVTLMRGLLENNAELAESASTAITGEIKVTRGEGIQPDFSFHQHGPQLQFGNYGLAFASDITKYAKTLHGTRFAFKGEKIAILRDYLLQGLTYATWNGTFDISACGRQLFPNSPRRKCNTFLAALKNLRQADSAHAVLYDNAIASLQGIHPREGNKLFWCSDFMVDHRPSYYASVKMNSPRVVGTELINQENVSGYYLGDGALYLYRTGHEYDDIFPVWDWRKLPGVTCLQTTGPLPPSKNIPSARNQSPFVGGVSNGHEGAAVLTYQRNGVVAKKSIFFLDGQIICLGAGLQTAPEAPDVPLVTTVAQRLLHGAVTLGPTEGQPFTTPERKAYPALKWAHHDGIGYVFLQPAPVTVGGAPQTGTWKNVYTAGPATPITKNIFTLWIDHGRKPRNATYAYAILPNATPSQTAAYAATPKTEILSNTPALQAVKCGNTLLAIFHQPGELAYGEKQKINTADPCALIIGLDDSSHTTLTAADPTQKLTTLPLNINGRKTTLPLPSGFDAGSSITINPPGETATPPP